MNINANAWASMSEDDLLMQWNIAKQQIEYAKIHEMELRKHIVSRAFPNKSEGTNIKELGNGYSLKAGVKFNYTLDSDNKKINAALDAIGKCGNNGAIIAARIIEWEPKLRLTEYRMLLAEKEESQQAREILKIFSEVLIIKEAAPTLEIKAPKGK